MISEYLKKFQSELMTNKEDIHKSIQTLELQMKENKAFQTMNHSAPGMLIQRAGNRFYI